MTVAVESQGSFELDVALARSLDGVVVLQTHTLGCTVLHDDAGDKLLYTEHQSSGTFYEIMRADRAPKFVFQGTAYVDQSGPITGFGPEAMDEAQEFYDSLVGPDEPVEV